MLYDLPAVGSAEHVVPSTRGVLRAGAFCVREMVGGYTACQRGSPGRSASIRTAQGITFFSS